MMKRVSAILIVAVALNAIVAEAGFDNLINKLNHRISGGRLSRESVPTTYSNHYAPQPTVSYQRQVFQRPSVGHSYPGGSASSASAVAAAGNGRGSGAASAAAAASGANHGAIPSHYHEPSYFVPAAPVGPRIPLGSPPSYFGNGGSAAASSSAAAGGDLASAASSANVVHGVPRFPPIPHYQSSGPQVPLFVPPPPPVPVHHSVGLPNPHVGHGGGPAAASSAAAASGAGGAAAAVAAAASSNGAGHVHRATPIFEVPAPVHMPVHNRHVPQVHHVQPVHEGGSTAASSAAAASGADGSAASAAAAATGAGHGHIGGHHEAAAGVHVDGGLGERESSQYARSTLSNNGVQYGDAEDDHYYHAGSYGQTDDENYYDNWNNDDENTVHTPNFYSTNKSKSSRVTSYNKGSRKSGSSVEAKDRSKNNYYHTNNSLQETVNQSHNKERDGTEEFSDSSSAAAYDHHDGWNYDSNAGHGNHAYATDHAKAGRAAASGSATSGGPLGGSSASSSAALGVH